MSLALRIYNLRNAKHRIRMQDFNLAVVFAAHIYRAIVNVNVTIFQAQPHGRRLVIHVVQHRLQVAQLLTARRGRRLRRNARRIRVGLVVRAADLRVAGRRQRIDHIVYGDAASHQVPIQIIV